MINFKRVALLVVVAAFLVGGAIVVKAYLMKKAVDTAVHKVEETVLPTALTIKDNYLARCEKEPELRRCIAVKKDK